MMRSRLSKEEDEEEELSSGDDVFRKCWITSLNSSLLLLMSVCAFIILCDTKREYTHPLIFTRVAR